LVLVLVLVYNLSSGPWNGCDESAAKGAAHDLKGLNHYFAASSGDINVPLMALIDYKGFRMTAQAVLPLGANSLIYGSNDAGRTVHRDPRFHDAMHKIADKLNLRAHFVGRTGELKELHSAVDIEGHKGDDGRLYILVSTTVDSTVSPSIDSQKKVLSNR
jgi:hypothetical protein